VKSNPIVFCDGACSGNPGPGGWGAIVSHGEDVVELGGRQEKTTNNQMELTGAIEALVYLKDIPGKVEINTDSTYVIKGITQWIHGWRKRGWVSMENKPVANRELWERLSEVASARGRGNISWNYVAGHSGNAGNDRVDQIAVSYSQNKPVPLYSGPAADYKVSLEKTAPFKTIYLSLVDNEPQRHATWAECESRVKGKKGAKYKKILSAAEEKTVLAGWGVKS